MLVSEFLLNFLCLCYSVWSAGLVKDFMELQNMFALATNLPFSSQLAGSCGGGPEGKRATSEMVVRCGRLARLR